VWTVNRSLANRRHGHIWWKGRIDACQPGDRPKAWLDENGRQNGTATDERRVIDGGEHDRTEVRAGATQPPNHWPGLRRTLAIHGQVQLFEHGPRCRQLAKEIQGPAQGGGFERALVDPVAVERQHPAPTVVCIPVRTAGVAARWVVAPVTVR